MKERGYLYTTPPHDTRRQSPRYSFPTIKVLAYNINNVFPYRMNVNCYFADDVTRQGCDAFIHVLKPTYYAERTRSSTHTTQKWCEEN